MVIFLFLLFSGFRFIEFSIFIEEFVLEVYVFCKRIMIEKTLDIGRLFSEVDWVLKDFFVYKEIYVL